MQGLKKELPCINLVKERPAAPVGGRVFCADGELSGRYANQVHPELADLLGDRDDSDLDSGCLHDKVSHQLLLGYG